MKKILIGVNPNFELGSTQVGHLSISILLFVSGGIMLATNYYMLNLALGIGLILGSFLHFALFKFALNEKSTIAPRIEIFPENILIKLSPWKEIRTISFSEIETLEFNDDSLFFGLKDPTRSFKFYSHPTTIKKIQEQLNPYATRFGIKLK